MTETTFVNLTDKEKELVMSAEMALANFYSSDSGVNICTERAAAITACCPCPIFIKQTKCRKFIRQ